MLQVFKRVNSLIFIVSFVIGIFFTYLLTPMPKIIYKYPKPHEVDDYSFKDSSDSCYKYNANEVSCPTNSDDIAEFPIH